ncbi:MAG TPA: hypothetical protein PK359_14760 [Burkholderiaceae bacterium]|jgi:hypothetical protein|nr:hypothetical protein [Burkholderiaceae bacterium]
MKNARANAAVAAAPGSEQRGGPHGGVGSGGPGQHGAQDQYEDHDDIENEDDVDDDDGSDDDGGTGNAGGHGHGGDHGNSGDHGNGGSHGIAGGVGLGMGGPLPGPEIFSFEVSDGVVTSAERVINGKTIPFYTSGNAEFTLQGDDIVLTRTTSDSEHLIVFSDADSDGLYAITSRAEIETGMPDMGGGDDDDDDGMDDGDGDGDGHHDHAQDHDADQVTVTIDPNTSAITAVSRVLDDGSTRAIDNDNFSFALEQGLLIGTRTIGNGATHWEIYRDGNADGTYTEVAHGSGELVDLVAVLTLTEPNIDML